MKTAIKVLGMLTVSLCLANANVASANNFHEGGGHSGGGVHGGGGQGGSGLRGGGSVRSSRDFRVGGGFRGGGFRGQRGFPGFQRGYPYGYATGVYGATASYYCAPAYYCYPYYSGSYDYSVAAPDANESLTDYAPPPAATPDQSQPAEASVQSPTTSVADIEAMTKAEVNDAVIIGQIRNSHSVYHLSAGEIIDLKKSGVSEHVIEFMVNTPSS